MKHRHCLVWGLQGRHIVLACAHCDHVQSRWPASTGDERRIEQSQEAHDFRCDKRARRVGAA